MAFNDVYFFGDPIEIAHRPGYRVFRNYSDSAELVPLPLPSAPRLLNRPFILFNSPLSFSVFISLRAFASSSFLVSVAVCTAKRMEKYLRAILSLLLSSFLFSPRFISTPLFFRFRWLWFN